MARITLYRNRWVVRWRDPEGVQRKRSFRTREEADAYQPTVYERPRRKSGPRSGGGSVTERIKSNVVVDAQGCWIWQRRRMRKEGYGLINVAQRTLLAHRVSYEAFVGAIPDGLQLDHLCRVRHCVNPQHLQPVTARENIRRSPIHISVIRATKTHCVNGHEFTPENTYRHGPQKRWRVCRTCSLARMASKRGK